MRSSIMGTYLSTVSVGIFVVMEHHMENWFTNELPDDYTIYYLANR
jgi:hypothetical protein